MGSKKNAWLKFDDAKKQEIFHFCEGYKKYISDCKTEKESIKEAISLAEAKGYRDLKNVISTGESLKAGDKVLLGISKEEIKFSVKNEKTLDK